MFSALPSMRTRIAIAASPAPRNTAFSRNSSSTVAFPPSMMAVNRWPERIRSGDPPINPSSRDALGAAARAMMAATPSPSRIDCPAARDAPSGSCAPIRRATSAVAPIDSPIATV
jgi:hypothetical protein